MGLSEFVSAVENFVEKARNAGIPLQDIIDELEDLQSHLEDKKAEEEEEEEEGEKDDG